MHTTRDIIQIDEELCDGCGQCVTGCAEAALRIVDGKARLVADRYCDGLGACLGHCPTGALKVIKRPAEAFDEHAVEARVASLTNTVSPRGCPSSRVETLTPEPARPDLPCGCSGSQVETLAPAPARPDLPCGCSGTQVTSLSPCDAANTPQGRPAAGQGLSSWPIKLRLVPPDAPFLKGARLLLVSDCAPPAMPDFHRAFLPGRVALLGCPKFDDVADYINRLAAIIREAKPRDLTVMQMEVPCCSGMTHIALRAAALSGRDIPVKQVVVSRHGKVIHGETLNAADMALA